MNLVEVDLLHAETRKRRFAGLDEIGAAGIVRRRRNDPALGGQHHPAPAGRIGLQDLAEQGFSRAEPCPAKAVDVGGIDQGHAEIQRGLDQRLGLSQIMSQEAPASKAQRPNATAAGSDLYLTHHFRSSGVQAIRGG